MGQQDCRTGFDLKTARVQTCEIADRLAGHPEPAAAPIPEANPTVAAIHLGRELPTLRWPASHRDWCGQNLNLTLQ